MCPSCDYRPKKLSEESRTHMLSCANNSRTTPVIFLGGEIFDCPGYLATFLLACVVLYIIHLRKIHVRSIGVRSRAPSHSKNLLDHVYR